MFIIKLSDRIQAADSATEFNKLERHIRPYLEEYMIDKFLENGMDKESMEIKMKLMPMVCKYGH